MTTATLLPKKVHRELVAADHALRQEESKVRSLIQRAHARLRDAERRRSQALDEMSSRIEDRKRLARAIPNGMAQGQEDVTALEAVRRECEAKFDGVVARALDLLSRLEGRLADVNAEREALRINATWVECELAASQIMDAPPPLVRHETLAGLIHEVNAGAKPGGSRLFGSAKVESAQKALQKTIDKKRIARNEPFADLPAPSLATTSNTSTPAPQRKEPVHLVRSHPRPTASWDPVSGPPLDEVLARAATLGSHRRPPRRHLLPRLVLFGSLAYLLLLIGAFIGRALAP